MSSSWRKGGMATEAQLHMYDTTCMIPKLESLRFGSVCSGRTLPLLSRPRHHSILDVFVKLHLTSSSHSPKQRGT